MSSPPPRTERTAADPAARYLDLMKRCLTRAAFPETVSTYVPDTPRGRRILALAQRWLGRRDLGIYLRAGSDPATRQDGSDWPATAETMIGLERLDNVQHCVEAALEDDVPGDLLEAGVWRGGASILMRGVLAAHGDPDRVVWAADSFAGLPPPDPGHAADAEDLHHTQPFLAVGLDEVRANFARYGLLDDRVRFLEGWFRDTLPAAPIQALAVLRADGDMYGSTMDILTALYAKVSPGGFVIIDDYGAIPACKLAVDEFREARGITEPLEPIDWTGVFWRRAG